jgi:predicted membrane chloride channel (bestrophin family)
MKILKTVLGICLMLPTSLILLLGWCLALYAQAICELALALADVAFKFLEGCEP